MHRSAWRKHRTGLMAVCSLLASLSRIRTSFQARPAPIPPAGHSFFLLKVLKGTEGVLEGPLMKIDVGYTARSQNSLYESLRHKLQVNQRIECQIHAPRHSSPLAGLQPWKNISIPKPTTRTDPRGSSSNSPKKRGTGFQKPAYARSRKVEEI
jgi:hypothetical protein